MVRVTTFVAACPGNNTDANDYRAVRSDSRAELPTICAICRKVSSPVITLTTELGLDRSNAANIVDRLTKRGLLRQKVSAADQRKKEITITKAGEKIMDQLEGCAQRFQRKLLGPLTDSEREVFIDLLTRLVQGNNHLGRALLRMT